MAHRYVCCTLHFPIIRNSSPEEDGMKENELDDFILSNIDALQSIENVDSVERVNDKWTDLGVKPHGK